MTVGGRRSLMEEYKRVEKSYENLHTGRMTDYRYNKYCRFTKGKYVLEV